MKEKNSVKDKIVQVHSRSSGRIFFTHPFTQRTLRLCGEFTVFLIAAGLGAVPERPRSAAPTEALCRNLYRHQLDLAERSENPIFAAVRMNRKQLEQPATVASQIRNCLGHLTVEDIACQMSAVTYQELLNCQQVPAVSADPSENKKPENDSGQQIVVERVETTRVQVDAVNTANCRKTYEHMLRVYTSSTKFAGERDREKLLTQWRTEASRLSFERRCLAVFQPSDLSCILSSSDPDVIQGCLIDIPPE